MVVVVNYGVGNLRSVSKALERVGVEVIVTSEPKFVKEAEAVVMPGVGTFHEGMRNLKKFDILEALYKFIEDGRAFLGICLGLQLLFTESEEGKCPGLNLIKGKVKKLNSKIVKVPHMGWNQVKIKKESALFENIPDLSFMYFAHTYYPEPEDENIIIGTTKYGKEFAVAIQKDNIFGVQFHPEKSGELGLKILKNFISYGS